MQFEAIKAKRELIWSKIALMAPSGGGKTYSSLRLATGMLEKLKELKLEQNGRILLANTESSRGKYYANEFEYDIVNLTAPHHPEMYIELIQWAVDQDYPILIIDSSSHEWEGKGGCLELHQQAGGSYQAWAKVTPRHDKFITTIADSPIHIIATMRGKDAYEVEKTDSNKINVKKLGIGAKQREGFEYEFTVTFLIDQKTNIAESQKDNTHLFEKESGLILSERHGREVIEWANSGDGYTIPIRDRKTDEDLVFDLKEKIIESCKRLGGSANPDLMKVLKKYDKSGNPNRVKDKGKLEKLSEELAKMEFELSDEEENQEESQEEKENA